MEIESKEEKIKKGIEGKFKNKIRFIFIINLTFMLFIIISIIKFYREDSFGLVNKTLNPRVFIVDENVIKGSIYDSNGMEVAKTVDGRRVYKKGIMGEAFFHLIGYVKEEGFGLESNYSLVLQKVGGELNQRINAIEEKNVYGNNLHLTIDGNMQKKAYEQIVQSGKNGSIIMLEPSTGKVIAMVSNPSVNYDNAKYKKSDEKKFLNRSTSGLYAPGSVFKVVSSITIMENRKDYENEKYMCIGHIDIEGNIIKCYNEVAHGEITLEDAIEQSCNTYFAYMGNEIGIDKLRETAEKLNFNDEFNFEIEVSKSKFTKEEVETSELMQTYIGQGKTLTTPLNMVTILGGVGNGGIMMKPYVIDYISDYRGKVVSRTRVNMD